MQACAQFRVQSLFHRCRAIGLLLMSLFYGIFRTKRTNEGDEAIESPTSVHALEVKVKAVFDRFRFLSLLAILALAAQGTSAQSQGWFRTGTGLGDANKPRLAIADFAARTDLAKPHA